MHFFEEDRTPAVLSFYSYYFLIKFFNQKSRGSRGIFSAKALKIRLIQNLYAPYGAIKTFR